MMLYSYRSGKEGDLRNGVCILAEIEHRFLNPRFLDDFPEGGAVNKFVS